ncbi:hypothetical protein [Ramlibacter sp. WS9]|uniref:hypothetical protein n=1 Tax=Ramlibacter sp. WS9 TaxID=1882741 RepID=UPI0013052F30|nr:hypothetical protein [Ramlibacter sp. WS9]
MSYLSTLRLHFAGQFQANVSTVNNDPGHFDNAAFLPSYQLMQGDNMQPPNGWFNPQGDAAWRFLGCAVTAAWTPSGAVPGTDPVLQCIVADSDGRAPAKLVDLDSEQQLVSEIWGLQVRIADASGNTLMRGDFEPAAFADIWDRATGAEDGGDVDAGAMYQSVLTHLQWGDVTSSPFLLALQAAASDGLLSIKFNVDSLNMTFTSPDFMCGRIVGTIGPATAAEPRHMVIGRQFMAAPMNPPPNPPPNFFEPQGNVNFCTAVVDTSSNSILLDLGNAISTSATTGDLNDLGDLVLGVYSPIATPGNPAGTVIALGTIPSQGSGGYASDPTWYGRTAGIVALPLTNAQQQAIAASQLWLTGSGTTAISEWASGAYVRADTYVYRMSPGDVANVAVFATQWGQPLEGASVGFVADPSQLQAQVGSGFPFIMTSPAVATPADALAFNTTGTTDNTGLAVLTITASDPGTPRYFNNGQDYGLDGQVYGIRPSLTGSQYTGPVNQWDFVSVLLWSGFTPGNPVTWNALQPIFQQYANLYPVMNRFLNLADYASVVANASLLLLAFGLDPANPNAMPVTRDLSPAKRNAILDWLKNPLPGPPLAKPAAPKAAGAAAHGTPGRAAKGGKAAAAARRLVLQTAKTQ